MSEVLALNVSACCVVWPLAWCWTCSQLAVLCVPAGRCASCGENVVGEGTGCTAMDQVFHVDCFVCMTCGTKLRGKPFFAVEKKAFCEPCYIVSTGGVCHSTCLTFRYRPALVFMGRKHRQFRCPATVEKLCRWSAHDCFSHPQNLSRFHISCS